ncbi:hypothetical protein [Escherichia coli]|uniref:hypothetical protein n=1 Tax=Escherichia coli TaxID=562 RepID=UPI0015F1B372|nr:hypothetical protein [Escherichia coli]
MSIKNDGHYFCRAGGNRPDGLNEPVTDRAHLQMILWLISGNMKNSLEDESAGVAGVV